MNEQMQQQLASYLKEFVETMKAGWEFALTQAPLIVQEKIAYGRVMETGYFVLFVVGAVVCLRIALWATRRVKDTLVTGDEPPYIIAEILAVGGCVVFAIAALTEFQTVVQVWFAPRLYILEWAASLLK
jgi:hypothetical protein